MTFGILGRVAAVAIGLVVRLLGDLRARCGGACVVPIDVVDVHVDERGATDLLRIPVVAAGGAEEDARAVADVELGMRNRVAGAFDPILLAEAEGLPEPVDRGAGVRVEQVRLDRLPQRAPHSSGGTSRTCCANIQRWPSRSSTR